MRGGKREGAGRKPSDNKKKVYSFRLSSVVNTIAGNKSQFVQQAINEKLERDGQLKPV